MPEKQDTIFADGLSFNLPPEKAPDFIKGRLSIDVEKFTEFLNENKNSDGYVNVGLKESKAGNGYAVLDTWKPTNKKPKLTEEEQEAKQSNEKINVASGEGIEYPEEEINPDDIPF